MSSSRAFLQEQVLQLKAELNESNADGKRYRQRLVHLEHDLQGKVQWMLAWERQIASKGRLASVKSNENGPNGCGWSAWKTFVDRGVMESQKTQRLLSRTVNLEQHRSTHDDLAAKSRRSSAALQEAEAELRSEESQNARLAATLRKRESSSREKARKYAALETLQAEITASESELSRLQAAEVKEERHERCLEGELAAESRKLNETPAHQFRIKLENARERNKLLGAECLTREETCEKLEQQAENQGLSEVAELQSMLDSMDQSHGKAEEEIHRLRDALEEAALVAALDYETEVSDRQRTKVLAQLAKSDALIFRQRQKARELEEGCVDHSTLLASEAETQALCREMERREGWLAQIKRDEQGRSSRVKSKILWEAEALQLQIEREKAAVLRIQRMHRIKAKRTGSLMAI